MDRVVESKLFRSHSELETVLGLDLFATGPSINFNPDDGLYRLGSEVSTHCGSQEPFGRSDRWVAKVAIYRTDVRFLTIGIGMSVGPHLWIWNYLVISNFCSLSPKRM